MRTNRFSRGISTTKTRKFRKNVIMNSYNLKHISLLFAAGVAGRRRPLPGW